MNVLIVGNGFDLAHGYKTHYVDFLDFIAMVTKEYRNPINERYRIDFKTVNEYKTLEDILEHNKEYYLKEKELKYDRRKFSAMEAFNTGFKTQNKPIATEKNLVKTLNSIFPLPNGNGWNEDYEKYNAVLVKFLHGNAWLDYFDIIYKNRYETNQEDHKKEYKEKKGWIDFEAEIGEVIKIVEQDFNKNQEEQINATGQYMFIDTLYKKMKEENLGATKDDLASSLYNELEILEYILELYLYAQESLEIKKVFNQKKLKNELKIDSLLSFNYTNIYARYYDTNIENIDFIHGKLSEHNIILGIDETLTTNEEIEHNTSCIHFKKYFQRISKKCGINKLNWINEEPELGSNAIPIRYHNIYVIGHSLDVTDKDILKKVFTHDNVQRITIYYFNKKDKERKMVNLLKVLGKEKFVELNDKKILVFKSQEELMQA